MGPGQGLSRDGCSRHRRTRLVTSTRSHRRARGPGCWQPAAWRAKAAREKATWAKAVLVKAGWVKAGLVKAGWVKAALVKAGWVKEGWVKAALAKAGGCLRQDAGPSAGSALPRTRASPSASALRPGNPTLGGQKQRPGKSWVSHVQPWARPPRSLYPPSRPLLFSPLPRAGRCFVVFRAGPKNGGSGLSSPALPHEEGESVFSL